MKTKEERKAYYEEYSKRPEVIKRRKEYVKAYSNNSLDTLSPILSKATIVCDKEYYQRYYKKNKEKISEHMKEWYVKNRQERVEKSKAYNKIYIPQKYKNDPLFRLTCNIRSLITSAFRRKFTQKSKKTIEILGCSFEGFKEYLEKQFDENMNWNNHGSYWEIDHVVPISLAKDEKELCELSHHTNFQPLEKSKNRLKSNKLGFIP